MKISVIGAGYVGLVTGVCLAEKGHQVICVDIDTEKVNQINRGRPPIYEKGLRELLENNVNTNFSATNNLYNSVLETGVTFISVGTPYGGNAIDLSQVTKVAREIGLALKDKDEYHLVVVKSTVVPGTTDEVVCPILEQMSGKKAGVEFGLGMNPEFLTEGVAVRDFMFPDRIVIGGIDTKSIEIMETIYRRFEGVEVIRTNNKTAEMIKYAANALLATMISFSNEIGNLCASIGDIDVVDVMKGVHFSNYLSTQLPSGERFLAPITSFLEAGCGFGGSCLPKDVKALVSHGRNSGKPMELLDTVIRINERQHREILALIKKHFSSLDGVRIAILGLAFKPDTSDMRESPAVPVIKALLSENAQIKGYDPVANDQARRIFGERIEYCDNLRCALSDVDVVVLVTRWDEFLIIPELLSEYDPPPLFIDGRRMLDRSKIARYEGIGI